ncbi:YgdI/YgdR family lipoprotein [Companilactobacillus kedongensis]|uniref:hypothetical protein n=1 Tax=Companilactobacillus kedongensis TaxID=2486004 RepID=UPI000F7AFDB3|nr:hypothetical protein [Companilactobacillus kedongensis]
MKYKKYLLVMISALFLLVLAGCSNNSTTSTKSNNKSNKEIVIKGHNFKGIHHGNGTAKDPDYKYSMYFGKDGSFVQDIISSKGFAGRFTEKGTYTIATNGNITMNIDNVTEERFNNDSDLSEGMAPISIVQREGGTLNAAENHPIKIENKKTYLLGTVNNVKLYPTDRQTVKYNKHYQNEKNKYDNAYSKFSNHGFTSNGMDTPMNAIAFKGSKYIWRYGYQDAKNTNKNSAVMAVFEGTYSYNSNSHIMTLKVSEQSNAYYGNLMSLGGFEYQKSGSPLAGTTLRLKYNHNVLTLLSSVFSSWKMEDNYPDDASQSLPKYDDYLNSYSVSSFNSQMHKESSSDSEGRSVKEVFPTKEDFADWVTEYYQQDEEMHNFHVLEAGDGATLPVAEEAGGEKTATPMVYRLYYSVAEEGNEESDVGRNVGIALDGTIYNGHIIMKDPDLTQAYKDYANN